MSAATSRRAIFAGAAALPVLAQHRAAIARPGADARLLQLAAELRAVDAAIGEAVSSLDAVSFGPDPAAVEAAELAIQRCWQTYDAILAAIAATPAEGFAGLAVKAARLAEALDGGVGSRDRAIAASLVADALRLAAAPPRGEVA